MPEPCPCQSDPLNSPCSVWDGNEQACLCAEYGMAGPFSGLPS